MKIYNRVANTPKKRRIALTVKVSKVRINFFLRGDKHKILVCDFKLITL